MPKPATVIGITGGISTGKSTFSRCLQKLTGARLFDAPMPYRGGPQTIHPHARVDQSVLVARRADRGAPRGPET